MIATIEKAPIMAGLIRVENRIAKTQSNAVAHSIAKGGAIQVLGVATGAKAFGLGFSDTVSTRISPAIIGFFYCCDHQLSPSAWNILHKSMAIGACALNAPIAIDLWRMFQAEGDN